MPRLKPAVVFLIEGFIIYALGGLAVARVPWTRSHLPAVLILLISIFFVFRKLRNVSNFGAPKERKARLLSLAEHFLWFLAGASIAWVLIFGAGRWRYSRAVAHVAEAGMNTVWPPNDIVEKTKKNGQIILLSLANDEKFLKSWDAAGKKDGKTLNRAFQEARKAAWTGEGLEAALEAVSIHRLEWQPAVAAVNAAQAAPMFSWNIDYSVPFYRMEIPKFAYLLKTERSLCAESMALCHAGKLGQAEEKLLQAFWLAGKVQDSPSLIAAMMAVAMKTIVVDGAQILVRKGQGRRIVAACKNDDLEAALHRALEREFVLPAVASGQMAGSDALGGLSIVFGSSERLEWLERFWGIPYAPWLGWDCAAWVEGGIALFRCLSLTPVDAARCMSSISDGVGENGWVLQSIAMPKFNAMLLKGSVYAARRKMLRIAFAAVQHKAKEGHWPRTLEALGDAGALKNPMTQRDYLLQDVKGRFELSTEDLDKDLSELLSESDRKLTVRL
jgi:hypothetical protein